MSQFICTGRRTHPPEDIPTPHVGEGSRATVELHCPVCGRHVRIGYHALMRLTSLRFPSSSATRTWRKGPEVVRAIVGKADTPPRITGPVDISLLGS